MSTKATFASVTSVGCTCRFLEQRAADPDSPIRFDAALNEFNFEYRDADGHRAGMRLYRCPFCGGAAPPSRRHKFFAEISGEESERLRELLSNVDSVAEAWSRLGPPDEDNPKGQGTREVDALGQPGEMRWFRVLRYKRLSESALVTFVVQPDGKLHVEIQGKYEGPPSEA